MKDITSAPAFLSMTGSLIAVCLMAAGCSSSRIDPEETGGEMISFSSSLSAASEVAATKTGAGSTLIDRDAELQGQPFGIYGYKSVDDASVFDNVFTSTAAQKVYYTTAELSKTDAKGNSYTVAANTWTYDDRQKWERAKHYRFRAFWPFSANVNSASTAKFLAIEYQQVEDYDLLVAYSTRYPMTEGVERVPMKFRHALSGLRFRCRYKKTESLVNVSDKVTSLYVQGLYLSGTMIFGEAAASDSVDTIRWNINENNFDDGSTGTRIFDWTGSEEFKVGATTSDVTVATVFDNDKVVFAIPQTLSDDKYANREARIYFTTETGGNAVQKVKIPKTALVPGKIYTFTLVISDSNVKVNIDIEDWAETQSNIDIYF